MYWGTVATSMPHVRPDKVGYQFLNRTALISSRGIVGHKLGFSYTLSKKFI